MTKAVTGTRGEVRIYCAGYPDAEITTPCLVYGDIWAVHRSLDRVHANWSTGAPGVKSVIYSFTPEWGKEYCVTHAPTGYAAVHKISRTSAIALAKTLANGVPTMPGVFGEAPTADALKAPAAVIRDYYAKLAANTR